MTPSEFKAKLLNEIEEHWNILTQYLIDVSIRTQTQLSAIEYCINQWNEFKNKSIVAQIHDSEINFIDEIGFVDHDK